MSELRTYDVIMTPSSDGSWVLKSEADEVIAEKDAEIAELKEQVHDYALGSYVMQARAEKEARHYKYKRCLAMAKMCGIMSAFEDGEWYAKWINKWYKRWLQLAKKFKEAK